MSAVHYDFDGRFAVVTGGGSFGVAIAERLLGAGGRVALWDADAASCEAALAARPIADRVLAQVVDINEEAAAAEHAGRRTHHFGHVDTLVNNAGILAPVANTWDHTPAAVLTRMSHALTDERRDAILARIPMARFLESVEVAHQVAWLCSADCSFATAAVFDLSGGRATY